ncbi:uncharacterized protein LOC118814914 [Colossoma macropomum]|uniref:uncharacterized protein LOC118814914 n=1 Tax=Colossoma macropomum TaxID=42526 RepID=UPI001864AF4D|nr:uncharacterized protein LOC118814914 [Colossoma macropomum]XP_036436691.1 uncharacterized protein LOC118814914 [Colossoma macropomum]
MKSQLNYLRCVSGNTLHSDEGFLKKLAERKSGLKEVSNVEECDVIIGFCPVVSRAGTDIEVALKKIQDLSDTKPVALVVLHHTFDPEYIVPDSSCSVNREKTLTVDCVFHEDRGFLRCRRNQEAVDNVRKWIKLVKPQKSSEPAAPVELTDEQRADEEFMSKVKPKVPGLVEVSNVEDCDFILVYCHTVSPADSSSTTVAAQQILQGLPDKPALLVGLHYTDDPEYTVPDSSRGVNREHTLTVDCLYHEDKGILQCPSNQEALHKVTDWIKPLVKTKSIFQRFLSWLCCCLPASSKSHATAPNPKSVKESCAPSAKEPAARAELTDEQRADEEFMSKVKNEIPGLIEVSDVEDCDFILVYCHTVSPAEVDTLIAQQILQGLPDKPALLVGLHNTDDPDYTVPDSSRGVNREHTLTVDCLYHNDRGLLQCPSNQDALHKVSEWIKPLESNHSTQVQNPHHPQTPTRDQEFQVKTSTALKAADLAARAELIERNKQLDLQEMNTLNSTVETAGKELHYISSQPQYMNEDFQKPIQDVLSFLDSECEEAVV